MATNPKRTTFGPPLPVPAPLPIPPMTLKGKREPKGKNVVYFETPLPYWGLLRSFRIYFYKCGVRTGDLVMKDLGVRLGENPREIRLKVQTFDVSDGKTPASRYEAVIDIDFLAQELGIDWSSKSTRRR